MEYELDDDALSDIENDLSLKFESKNITYSKKYDNTDEFLSYNSITIENFLDKKLASLGLSKDYATQFLNVNNIDAFNEVIANITKTETDEDVLDKLKSLSVYFENNWKWQNPIDEYIIRKHIKPNLPKFMYYDDYYALESEFSLVSLNKKIKSKAELTDPEKTAQALLEVADINLDKLLDPQSEYEDFTAELEATQTSISEVLFKYWKTNTNLRILFDIDKVNKGNQILDYFLHVRVENLRTSVSLPLKNRSKGFNWFFSFLVWFKKIQENPNNTYILLLDEPGLNLHAMAQADLLNFINYLSQDHQVIYTTHSPFMINSDSLQKVRTVLEKTDGTQISETVQEKDPNTLFPLQAALGYTLAQNLFVSSKNLIVEGVSDLVYMNVISNKLIENNREGLRDDITIVPVGGADKVATFVSLMRGNRLDMLCVLDTFRDQSAEARLKDLTIQNIIKDKQIIFYHYVTGTKFSDIEDFFEVSEYLSFYNRAFSKNVDVSDIDDNQPIIDQLIKLNDNKRFNHYAPANFLAKNIQDIKISDKALKNFEALFKKINKCIPKENT